MFPAASNVYSDNHLMTLQKSVKQHVLKLLASLRVNFHFLSCQSFFTEFNRVQVLT